MVKVKLSVCLIKHGAMKEYEGVEILLHMSTSILDVGEWQWTGRFFPGEGDSVTQRIGGWLTPRAPVGNPTSIHWPSSPWKIAIPTEVF
jgi:hypothetical protein